MAVDMNDMVADTVQQLQRQLQQEQSKKVMEWLCVDSPERATEVIARLEEIGLTLKIELGEIKIETIEDEDSHYTIQADQDIKLELVPIKP